MTMVPHDHRARGCSKQRVAGMTVVLGDSLFSSDFYCPLYPGIYRALLRAWQEYHNGGAGRPRCCKSRCCRPAFASHPSPSPRLCVILRPQGAPGVLTGQGCGEGSRHAHPSHLLGSSLSSHRGDTANAVAFLGHGRGCKVEGCTGVGAMSPGLWGAAG